MSAGARNVHALAATLRQLEHDAATGTCALESCGHPAAGFISSWDKGPRGICAEHIPGAMDLGYEVYIATTTRRGDGE